MRAPTRSVRKLNVRPESTSLKSSVRRCTSGLMEEVGGAYAPAGDDQVIAAALRILSNRLARSDVLSNPRVIREYLTVRLAGLEHEVFSGVFLDNRLRVIACEELFRGTIDGAGVYPREVVKRALVHNAAAVVFAHNHPSGIAEPSVPDQLITRRLGEALALVDIRLIDHFIIAGATSLSMAERGLL